MPDGKPSRSICKNTSSTGKRKISFADGSFTSFIELIIKHKDEKFLLALSEPHKPELPETLAKLKMSFDPAILARTSLRTWTTSR